MKYYALFKRKRDTKTWVRCTLVSGVKYPAMGEDRAAMLYHNQLVSSSMYIGDFEYKVKSIEGERV